MMDLKHIRLSRKGTDYVPGWKSNGVYNSKLKTLYAAFLHKVFCI